MFKFIAALIIGLATVANATTSPQPELNPTQKQFLKNTTIAAELSNGKISDKFKFQIYHNLKSDVDRQAWMNVAGKWAKYDVQVTAYFDQFYIYEHGVLSYTVRVQTIDGRIQAVVNDFEKIDIDPKNIYQSLKKKKTTASVQKRLPALFLGDDANADEDLPLREQLTFATIASSTNIGLAYVDSISTPALMDRDSNIKIKMGDQEVPSRDYLAKLANLVNIDTKIKCSSKFSGSVDGKPYTANVVGDRVTIDFKDSKYLYNANTDYPSKLAHIPFSLNELESSENKLDYEIRGTGYQMIDTKCQVDRINAAFDGGTTVLMSNKVDEENYRIDCINKMLDRGTVSTKLNCISGDCFKITNDFGSSDDLRHKIHALLDNFSAKYNYPAELKCRGNEDNEVKCRLSGTPPSGLPATVLADLEDKVTDLQKQYIKANKKIDDQKQAYEKDSRVFREKTMAAAQYVRSLDRCCSSDTCRVDMFRDTKIQLLPDTASPGIR